MSSTQVKIPCRISYASLTEPRAVGDRAPRYSCTLLIDKDDESTLEAIHDAVNEAISVGVNRKWDGSMPEDLSMPLLDGDERRPDDPAYKNCYFLNARSSDRPVLVDRNVHTIPDEERSRVYSGCYCNVVVDMYPFKSEARAGVAAELQYVQLVKDGETLEGLGAAHKWFQPLD